MLGAPGRDIDDGERGVLKEMSFYQGGGKLLSRKDLTTLVTYL